MINVHCTDMPIYPIEQSLPETIKWNKIENWKIKTIKTQQKFIPRCSTGYQGTTNAARQGNTGPWTKPRITRVTTNPFASPINHVYFT